MTAPDLDRFLRALAGAEVEFVIIGGVAAAMNGTAYATYDLDVVYKRSTGNMTRLVEALAPLQPYLRGAPPNLPFRFDVPTLSRGLNFTLTTTAGDIDLLGEVAGGGTYDSLRPDAEVAIVGGREVRYVSLRRLIALKRAAGRPKDLEMLATLEALLEERERSGQEGH